MILSNYHTHCCFCDGSSEPEDYVQAALKKNFKHLGFSSHAPLPFDNSWSLVSSDMEDYCKTIEKLKIKYLDQIEIFLSMEIDYIPGISSSFQQLQKNHHLDYILGAVHLVKKPGGKELWFIDGPVDNYDKGLAGIFHNDIRFAVESYFQQLQEMLRTQKPDLVAHFDKIKMNNKDRFFRETESWYKNLLNNTVEVISQCGTIVEVNTRGIYTSKSKTLYPGLEVLQLCHEMNIPVTISSDAHKPADINSFFAETEKMLKDIGYKSIKIFTCGKWVDWEI